MKQLFKRLKCFLGFHDWVNIDDEPEPDTSGGAVLWSALHECKRCKKKEHKGMGWLM